MLKNVIPNSSTLSGETGSWKPISFLYFSWSKVNIISKIANGFVSVSSSLLFLFFFIELTVSIFNTEIKPLILFFKIIDVFKALITAFPAAFKWISGNLSFNNNFAAYEI